MLSKTTFSTIMLFSAVSTTSLLWAQSPKASDQPDKPDETLSIPTIDLAKIVVQGNALASTPFQTVQSSDLMRQNMVQDERDLLRNEVGIGVTESGRAGSNGFAIRGVDKDRVAILVDGLPQAESFMPSIYKGYGYFNGSINNTEYENISQVMINKGANSVTDGSGAIGGSVRFTTKNIEDFVQEGRSLGGYWKSGYSSKNREWRQVLGAGFRHNGFFGFAQITKRRGHETINNGHGENIYGSARGKPDPLLRHSTAWLSKVGYEWGDHRITAFYERRDQRQKMAEKSFDSWGTYRFAEDTSPYRRYGLEYDYIATDSNWIDTINVIGAVQKIWMRSDTYNVKQSDPSIVDQHYFREFQQNQKFLKGELFTQSIAIGAQSHSFQAKAEYRHGRLQNSNHDILYLNGVAHPSRYSIMTPVKSRVFSLALRDEINLSESLQAVAGLRYDDYRYAPQLDGSNKFPVSFDDQQKHFRNLSWQLGLTYHLTPAHQVSYQIGTGFRAPRIEEMFFEFGKGGMNHFMSNPDLKPEKALNQEVSYQFQNDIALLRVGAFYSQYRNFIEERVSEGRLPNPWYDPNSYWGGEPYLSINQIQFVNVAKAHISGIEISGSLNGEALGLPNQWNFHLKGQYSKGRNQDGDPLKSIQPWSVIAGVDYRADSGRWNVALTGRYSAAKKGKDTLETYYSWRGAEVKEWPYLSKSYFVVDLTSQIKIDRDITMNIGVFNLFNRSYTTWDSLRDLPTFGTTNRIDRQGKGLERFTAPKRNFAISFEAKF